MRPFLILIIILLKPLINESFPTADLSYYEVIEFEQKLTDNKPKSGQIVKNSENRLRVYFNVYNKSFVLVGTRCQHIHPTIVHDSEHFKRDKTSHFYKGLVNNNQNSFFRGYIFDGKFLGIFVIENDIYHIEERNEQNENKNKVIVYRDSDLLYEKIPNNKAFIRAKKDIKEQNVFYRKRKQQNKQKMYQMPLVRRKEEKFYPSIFNRTKRQIPRNRRYYGTTFCPVEVIADHTFARLHNYDVNRIVNELNLLVEGASGIYQNTDFYTKENVGLKVANVQIHIHTNYSWADTRLQINEVLNLQSFRLQNYCASISVVNRDFGVALGLAWLGYPPSSNRGICSKSNVVSDAWANNKMVMHNTGVVSTLNRQRVRFRPDISLTFAHEMGHLFGTSHDEEKFIKWGCHPNFLMAAYAPSSSLWTSWRFTRCSVVHMRTLIMSRAPNCFTRPQVLKEKNVSNPYKSPFAFQKRFS